MLYYLQVRGQRELIIGDRFFKQEKQHQLLITILNQRLINESSLENEALIFVFMFAIGQKRSTITQIIETFF